MIRAAILLAGVLLLALCGDGGSASAEILTHGRFKRVEIFRPPGAVQHFAFLMSGDGGWNPRLDLIGRALAADGTLVAGVDTAALFANLEKDGGNCVSPDGDLENLSHYVQAYYKVPTYFMPFLIGYSAGATLAYASLAQAPPGIFAGLLTLSFCVELDLLKPMCVAQSLRFKPRSSHHHSWWLLPPEKLSAPWTALHGTQDQVCSIEEARTFVEKTPGAKSIALPGVTHHFSRSGEHWLPQLTQAYESLVASQQTQRLPVPPASLADLPVVEVEAVPGTSSDGFAVLLSGDGGWAGIDMQVAAELAARGVPTAGLDSLRYFWTQRTPEGLARDLDRILRYYAFHWHKKYALLAGYSQGADVLPFAFNRLPPQTRSLVRLTTLIGLSASAEFEFHVANWIGADSSGLAVLPEIERMSAADTLCVYGDDDAETICPKLGAHARVIELPGGHHFGGNYLPLAQLIAGGGRQN